MANKIKILVGLVAIAIFLVGFGLFLGQNKEIAPLVTAETCGNQICSIGESEETCPGDCVVCGEGEPLYCVVCDGGGDGESQVLGCTECEDREEAYSSCGAGSGGGHLP